MTVGRSAAAALVVLSLAVATGCGGSKQRSTSSSQPVQDDPAPKDELALPPGVPDRATGPAADASRRVINDWLKALRRGHIKTAAHFFALPSKFQNATPVLTIDIPAERIAINEALPCGAVPIKLGSAGDFTIVTFRLVTRTGDSCSAVGATARTAIRVADRHIREWYRLPDTPGNNGSQEPDGSTPVV